MSSSSSSSFSVLIYVFLKTPGLCNAPSKRFTVPSVPKDALVTDFVEQWWNGWRDELSREVTPAHIHESAYDPETDILYSDADGNGDNMSIAGDDTTVGDIRAVNGVAVVVVNATTFSKLPPKCLAKARAFMSSPKLPKKRKADTKVGPNDTKRA